MAGKKKDIWLQIADVRPIPLSINQEDEPRCREAESLVNSLWEKWMRDFADKGSSQEVLARVAFRFAQLYLAEYVHNKDVNNFLQSFEKSLDAAIIDVEPPHVAD